jgi:hypothetical protein
MVHHYVTWFRVGVKKGGFLFEQITRVVNEKGDYLFEQISWVGNEKKRREGASILNKNKWENCYISVVIQNGWTERVLFVALEAYLIFLNIRLFDWIWHVY